MLANPIDYDHRKWTEVSRSYVMEPKVDGVRCMVVVKKDDVHLSTRTGKDFTDKAPHLVESFRAIRRRIDYDFVVDGEVGYFNDGWDVCHFNETMRVVGSGVDEALRKQHTLYGPIRYLAFDCLSVDGSPLGADWQRRQYLESLQLTQVVDLAVIRRFPHWDEAIYSDIVERGGEGVILKNPHAEYAEGKRPQNHWYKVKKYESDEFVIIGFDPGKGKYEGMVGALIFGKWQRGTPLEHEHLIPLGKCSGMTDAQRTDMTTHWSKYSGQVVEIRFFGRVGSGEEGLRHPQFVRMRPDKTPFSCTLD